MVLFNFLLILFLIISCLQNGFSFACSDLGAISLDMANPQTLGIPLEIDYPCPATFTLLYRDCWVFTSSELFSSPCPHAKLLDAVIYQPYGNSFLVP